MSKFDVPTWQETTTSGVEAWAWRTNKLHPAVVDFLQPLFDADVKKPLSLRSVRQVLFTKNTSGKKTNVWVAGDTIVWTKGHLNQEHKQWRVDKGDSLLWWTSNGAIDLATQAGMGVLAHELRHVWQYRSRPRISSWLSYLWGIAKSLWYERRWYSHNQVPAEVDAIDWVRNHARKYIMDRRESLKQFEGLR